MESSRGKTVLRGVEAAIGNTPIIHLHRMAEPGSADILVKLEFLNPSGSIKDRTALAAVLDAEAHGRLHGDGTIVEATSGNMGAALSLVGIARGYLVSIVMPADVPDETKRRVVAHGGKVVQSPSVGGMNGAATTATQLAKDTPGAFLVDQFANPACAGAHRDGTGPEILVALDGPVDAFVAGVGTGATLMGVGEALKAKRAATLIVAVEPERSPMLSEGKAGPHRIAGIGADFMPPLVNLDMLDEVIAVSDKDAHATATSLVLREGLFVGPSSGANVAAALRMARRLGPGKTVVTVLPDGGERYFRSPV